MTDKQIIIDGVDVSQCEKYEHEIVRCNATLKNMCFCGGRCTDKKNADCYFKQLKQAEQKLENIKEICNMYQMEYIVNNGVKLLTTKILQIIGDE